MYFIYNRYKKKLALTLGTCTDNEDIFHCFTLTHSHAYAQHMPSNLQHRHIRNATIYYDYYDYTSEIIKSERKRNLWSSHISNGTECTLHSPLCIMHVIVLIQLKFLRASLCVRLCVCVRMQRKNQIWRKSSFGKAVICRMLEGFCMWPRDVDGWKSVRTQNSS